MTGIDYDTLTVRDYYTGERNPSASTYVHHQVLGLKRLGWFSLVISPNPRMPGSMRMRRHVHDPHMDIRPFQGIDVIRPPYLKFPASLLYNLTNRNLSRAIIRGAIGHGTRLIHAHFGQNGGAAVPLKRRLGVPLITSFYGHDAGNSASLFASVYRDLITEGDRFLALSRDMERDLAAIGFPVDRIRVHHLGVDIDEFRPGKSSEGAFHVLVVANLLERKGIHHAIRAFHKLHLEHNDTKLTIIGAPGPYGKVIFSLIRDLGLTEAVSYINNHDTPDPRGTILEHMRSCDIFVLPSLTLADGSKEGTPVVLMEASACSKPCVSTRHAGIPEIVLDEQTGFLVNEGDVDSIADRLETMYDDKALRESMGTRGRRHMENDFNIELQNAKLRDIYEELLN